MKTPLEKLEAICAEIYERWDKDQRSGKLLAALAGKLPNYRQDVTDVRQALAHQPAPDPAGVREECARIAEACSIQHANTTSGWVRDHHEQIELARRNIAAAIRSTVPVDEGRADD